MDVSAFLEVRPAPTVLFQAAEARADKVRYHIPVAGGGWQALTWRDHAQRVRAIAAWLLDFGLQPGERCAIFAPNRVEWMEAALGIQAAGGVMVPVYASNTADQLAYVLGHSDARVVFVDTPALLERTRTALQNHAADLAQLAKVVVLDLAQTPTGDDDFARHCLSWGEASQRGAALDLAHPQTVTGVTAGLDLHAPGIMLYTSGTSGNPKGVPLSHYNVGVNGRDWLQCNGPLVEEGDVDLLWLPMSHIFGYGEACLGNTLGFETWLTDPMSVMGLLPVVRPHVFMSVPSVWEKFANTASKADDRDAKLREVTGGRMRFCLSGGAGLKREVKETFLRAGMLIIEGYGLTESSPTLTLNRPDAFRFDSVGKPLPSVELKLAEDGEIMARGPNVFKGYHKDPEGTANVLTADGWLLTGDVGRWTEDGFLQIIDRKKDILVTAGGKNVAPANIELQFADEPLIAQAVVYGDAKRYLVAGLWPNQLMADHLLAHLPPEERKAEIARRIAAKVEAVNATVAHHETVKTFKIFDEPLTVENGLLTPTLKIRRKKIYERFGGEFEALYQ